MACCLCALLVIAGALIAAKIYMKLFVRRNGSYTCLVGKTAIVTGANTGLGYVTALDFAKRGARVILACRNQERAENAVAKIIAATGNRNVLYKLVDFASLQSVRDFAEDINKNEERVDILVNNAGIWPLNDNFTADGIQETLHVNHISSFLLTHLLIDKLKRSAPSRVVNVTSLMARVANLNVENVDKINTITSRFRVMLYNNSKLCNILFTTELAKRLDGTGVTVYAVHPGAVHTDVFRQQTGFTKLLYEISARLFYQTPEEGAQTQIYVSVSNDVASVTGGLFYNCRQVEVYQNAKDADLERKVWVKSEELAKLREEEKIPYFST